VLYDDSTVSTSFWPGSLILSVLLLLIGVGKLILMLSFHSLFPSSRSFSLPESTVSSPLPRLASSLERAKDSVALRVSFRFGMFFMTDQSPQAASSLSHHTSYSSSAFAQSSMAAARPACPHAVVRDATISNRSRSANLSSEVASLGSAPGPKKKTITVTVVTERERDCLGEVSRGGGSK
jgi:hypothetical protein